MPLTRSEFAVLDAVAEIYSKPTQRAIASFTDLALGTVNNTLSRLRTQGLIGDDGRPTEAGMAALAPYRVGNAIILAAGDSSYLRTIGFEKPKALLTHQGEVLVERKIEQIKAAGIDDIVIVAGYRKEHLFYLAEKYGVRIVENPGYKGTNTILSLWSAHEYLSGSYVCMSDDWFEQSPFRRYVYRTFFATTFEEGPTDKWCVETGRGGRIVRTGFGMRNAQAASGFAYIDRAFCERFVPYLEHTLQLRGTTNKYWEEVWFDHIDEFDMGTLALERFGLLEFKFIPDLARFGTDMLDNTDPQAVEHICRALDCGPDDISACEAIVRGETKATVRFDVRGSAYTYRKPLVELVRRAEAHAPRTVNRALAQAGIGEPYVAGADDGSWTITRYEEAPYPLDVHSADDVRRLGRAVEVLHGTDAEGVRRVSYADWAARCEHEVGRTKLEGIEGFAALKEKVVRLGVYFAEDGYAQVFSHNALGAGSVGFDKHRTVHLLNWEWAGVSDVASDFASLATSQPLSDAEIDSLLEQFLGRAPEPGEQRHYRAACVLCAWNLYLWALVRETQGEGLGRKLYESWSYTARHVDEAIASYER